MKKILLTIFLIFCLSITSFAIPLESQYDKSKDPKNIENIINFILGVNQKKGDQEGLIYLVGDTIDIEMLFEDIEKDYEGISPQDKLKKNADLDEEQKKPKAGTLQIKYTHNPSIFDNPDPKHVKGNNNYKIIASMQDPYVIQRATTGMRGEWTVTVQGSDTTKNDPFNKMATPKTRTYIIHYAPDAVIYMLETATHYILTGINSRDRDFQYSRANNGIDRYEWFYEQKDGSVYKYPEENQYIALPKIINGKEVTAFTLTVTDCYGAKGSTNITGLITPELFAELHPELAKFDIFTAGIPASEELKVTDIVTMPHPMDRIDFALYKDGVRKTNIRSLNRPSDITKTDILYHHWKDIRNYQIPETLPDGNYTAKATATQGTLVLEKNWSIRVKTPINLMPEMPNRVFTSSEITIEATTSKYANAVTVDVFSDGNPISMQLVNQVGDIKYWRLNYTVPFRPDGNYTARFRATTPNGNEEIKTLPFFLQTLDLKDLRITDIVNHKEYAGKYPIYYNAPEVPVGYKAGYYVTFKITAIGNPDSVKMKISHPGYNKTLNMVKESENGNESTWKLEWYSDPFLKKGTIINTEVTADKGSIHLNFNTKYGWDGDYLKVVGSIEGDWRIDQEL
ncbi:hypothetical protein [Geosporobacter ferrireducens]|uniref:Ig-like domain-containing protein n=1 Tax=Geosporobacter ferrireducens TaxID=1424294 RepID=A0A1D8GBS9_9FIRM|nr:hypothetical protein [Geosporobacter ferrireducens]AOT68340.1 hypothetical protein Gferi_01270 [Geosporobacter ferrireducens]